MINNNQDMIDSREVIGRIKELQDDGVIPIEDLPEDNSEIDEEDAEELSSLLKLQEQGETCGDWEHGATLIRDSYFEQYAQDFASDIGEIDTNGHMSGYIDWDRYAADLQVDYTQVEFSGETYWVL